MTNSQAKNRCQRRAIASHCGPGIVAQVGKARAAGRPSTSEMPSTPVVSKSVPAMRVLPTGPAGVFSPRIDSHGCTVTESWPQ